MTRAIVWSKDHCSRCDQAKRLLALKGIEYEERNIDQDWTRDQLLTAVPGARTLPQVCIGDQHIGGFMELERYLSKESR